MAKDEQFYMFLHDLVIELRGEMEAEDQQGWNTFLISVYVFTSVGG